LHRQCQNEVPVGDVIIRQGVGIYLPNILLKVQECDTTMPNSTTNVKYIKKTITTVKPLTGKS